MHYMRFRRLGDPTPKMRHVVATEARCIVCGATSPWVGRGHRRKFCSPTCHREHDRWPSGRPTTTACVGCGGVIDLTVKTKTGRFRRRADVKLCRPCRITGWPLSPQALAVRDGTSCGICGLEVDMSLLDLHPMRPSVDHVLARANGGSNDPTNLQLAHLRCNSVKGARLLVPSLKESM